VLDYSTKFEMSTSSLQKLTKTQILYPTDVENTIERLRALTALATFFFSERSYPSQGLTNLVHKCMDHKSLLRTQAFLDPEFIAKLLCAVDDRIHQWLRQCCNAKLVEETSLHLMDYSSLFDDILLNRFNYRLPPKIRRVQKRATENPFNQGDKRVKQTEQDRNMNPVQEWKLRHSEKWDTVFRAKAHEGPILSTGTKLCLKYHVKGLCYSDCSMLASHKELSPEDSKQAEAFIKQLRGE
jgi:hypothetical protein